MKRELALAIVLGSVIVGCSRDRSKEPPPAGQTTTTGAEMPAAPAPPPPAAAPAPAPETAPETAKPTKPAPRATRPRPRPTPNAMTQTTGAEIVQTIPPPPPQTTTPPSALPAMHGNGSFEQSGGSSGLGIYGEDVPGQELWRIGPSPAREEGAESR